MRDECTSVDKSSKNIDDNPYTHSLHAQKVSVVTVMIPARERMIYIRAHCTNAKSHHTAAFDHNLPVGYTALNHYHATCGQRKYLFTSGI
jgi:hypothetical protein